MAVARKNSYHPTLEEAVYDLVRVGATGFASGVAQMATRMIRTVPEGVEDAALFRQRVHSALNKASAGAGLRLAGGHVPTDVDSSTQLVDIDPAPDGAALVLGGTEEAVLNDVVLERQRADELREAGVPLTRSILLTGDPGVGKSLTAKWLAQVLQVPLITMSLSATVSSHLGTSGKNVRSVLSYAQTGPCVLLLDEFDAIAKNRDDVTDIGELKRVVNVVLLELDRWSDQSVLLAATNHQHLLDPAINRRFDTVLPISRPRLEQRVRLFANLGDAHFLGPDLINALAETTAGSTGSDIQRMFNAASRRAYLHKIPFDEVLAQEVARWAIENNQAVLAYRLLSAQNGWSNRRIALFAGVSHPTVASALKRVEK
jgi:ATP-dependent 26S proteasome regulatory subunit